MAYCVICKKKTDERFVLEVSDNMVGNTVKTLVCRDCFDRIVLSHHNKGIFGISKFVGWLRNKDLRRF